MLLGPRRIVIRSHFLCIGRPHLFDCQERLVLELLLPLTTALCSGQLQAQWRQLRPRHQELRRQLRFLVNCCCDLNQERRCAGPETVDGIWWRMNGCELPPFSVLSRNLNPAYLSPLKFRPVLAQRLSSGHPVRMTRDNPVQHSNPTLQNAKTHDALRTQKNTHCGQVALQERQ